MKKILITGVYGFLGSFLASKLNKNYKIYGIGRSSGSNVLKNCSKIVPQNLSLRSLSENFSDIDQIIHCAGTGDVKKLIKKNSFSELSSIKSVLEFIRLFNPKAKLIYISSASVYGDLYKVKIRENYKVRPISNYAKLKVLSENLCRNYSNKFNISVVILRVSSLYGQGLKKQIIYDATTKITNKNRIFLGTGNEKRDFLHVSDMAILINKIIKKNLHIFEIYNCGSQQIFTIRSIISKLEKIIKKKINPIFNHSFISLNPRILKIDTGKIAKMYNWYPKIKIEKGLRDYYSWYQKEHD